MPGKTFKAVLGGKAGDRPSVEIPFDVSKTFGAARAKVKATVNGVQLRTTVAVYAGVSYVGFRKEVREAMGVSIGDRIEVTLEADTAERVVEVPPDLEAAMKKDRAARKAFDGLAFTHRKEYARWVGEAKREETRKARVGKTIAMLKAGTKHP
jgi:bifunctional DNA-binding transcriptional regulator/antitoxin component of YhaV-PrlF toxin-antitoxin module